MKLTHYILLFDKSKLRLFAGALALAVILISGCKKEQVAAVPAQADQEENHAPVPAPPPVEPQVVTDEGNVEANLKMLTKELHRAMIGRKINRNFDEFVALRHLQAPPPPAGKKYAISSKWAVILVDN